MAGCIQVLPFLLTNTCRAEFWYARLPIWGYLRPLKFNVTRFAPIVSACMRLHNCCIDSGAPSSRAAMTADEQELSDAAFRRWWTTAATMRDQVGDG
jgi:hypothetical protein